MTTTFEISVDPAIWYETPTGCKIVAGILLWYFLAGVLIRITGYGRWVSKGGYDKNWGYVAELYRTKPGEVVDERAITWVLSPLFLFVFAISIWALVFTILRVFVWVFSLGIVPFPTGLPDWHRELYRQEK